MGALDNMRVVDFGHYVAGPVLGMLLADQGAEVIKVDPPGGPTMQTEANATWNRGKRSITLDLKDDEDRAVALDLARRADIVIENFRPGVMDRLGLGESDLRVHNRGLIYCSMPAFGPEDARSGMPGWEGVVLAAADGFRPLTEYRNMVQQLHRRPADREGDPVFTAEPIASMYAALVSAINVGAALNVRDQTGEGQRVEVPLFDAFIQAVGVYGMAQLPFRAAFGPAMNPWDHQYRCADGRWLQIVCTHPPHAAELAELLGRSDFVQRGLTERRLPDTAAHHELIIALTEIFSTRPAQEWEDLLVEHELPGAMCRSAAEWLDHPQAVEGGLLIDIDDPELGPTRQPAPVVGLTRSPNPVDRPAPKPDEHRAEILAELAEQATFEEKVTTSISPVAGPIDGLKVLDLGLVLAGPTCGRTLAELGADVIKIDDPKRDAVLYHYDVNRAKRTLLLDLATEEGRTIFWQLVEQADVVIENFRPGVVEDLGIDYEVVKRTKPDIIYVSINAYGDEGPWAELPGYDESVEALTGIQVRYGGADRPTVWPYGEIDDYGTGFAATFGVILAVLDRYLTGEGQRITVDLARTSGYLQSAHLIDHEAKTWNEPSGPGSLGHGPTQRLYRCEDGWIYLGARDAVQLEPIIGEVENVDDATLAYRLSAWCGQHRAAEAVARLTKHDVGAHELSWLNDAMMDPVVVRRGLSVIRDHGTIGLLRTTGPARWLSRSMIDAGRPAAPPGSDAVSVLGDIDRAGDVERLLGEGIIRVSDS